MSEDDDGIVFSKKDLVALTRVEGKIDRLNDKVDTIGTNLMKCQLNCSESRGAASRRLKALEDKDLERNKEEEVTTKLWNSVWTKLVVVVGWVAGIYSFARGFFT